MKEMKENDQQRALTHDDYHNSSQIEYLKVKYHIQ